MALKDWIELIRWGVTSVVLVGLWLYARGQRDGKNTQHQANQDILERRERRNEMRLLNAHVDRLQKDVSELKTGLREEHDVRRRQYDELAAVVSRISERQATTDATMKAMRLRES